jgi:hypothetical protein
MDLPLSFSPATILFWYSLSHQSSYFRWSTQGTMSSPTMLKTMGESNNQEANLPPPPQLTLEQVLAMQAQMLQTMQQTLINLHEQPQAPPPLRDRLGDFQRNKPPTFSYVVEPMDADDWLNSAEKKLQLV